MTQDPQKHAWHWDRYWQFNRIASCYDQAGSNYPAEFQREWAGFFAHLPTQAEILDLCTGNGAVARIAAKQALFQGKTFLIKAVDRAAIDPGKYVADKEGADMIEFVAGVRAEDLPFEDGRFHAAVSQYGLEYADRKKALRELARVVAPGGFVKLIVHAAEGAPAQDSGQDIARVDYLMNDLRIFDRARAAMEAMWQAERAAAPPTEDAKATARAFLEAINKLGAAREENPSPVFESTFGLLNHTFQVRRHFPLEALIGKIGEAELEARAHRERLAELCRVCMSEQECRTLAQAAGRTGLQPEGNPEAFLVGPERKLAGWKLAFKRVA